MPRVPPVTIATRDIGFLLVNYLQSTGGLRQSVEAADCLVLKSNCRSVLPLNRQRNAHATADAERGEALLGVAAQHFVQQGDEDAGARSTDRMADGDGAAVDIYYCRIPTHVLVDRERLRRKSLVGLY